MKKRIAAFIDRDGVITEIESYKQGDESKFLLKKEDIKIIPGSIEAVKRLNDKNIVIIVISNQPQIAKGLATKLQIDEINEEIKRLFKENGAVIDAIYCCPHHPKGSIKEYSLTCNCRKPEPGMILKAAKDYNIDLSRSYVIGDRISDIKAGNLAGCKTTIGVKTGYACNDGFKDAIPDVLVENILEASKFIIGDVK
ncbi:HAD family hydrolase [Candidatus Woesearchaeota archaeon]|nr:HAD family hydrolase [Candidatus Woesearchaeota archaeon]